MKVKKAAHKSYQKNLINLDVISLSSLSKIILITLTFLFSNLSNSFANPEIGPGRTRSCNPVTGETVSDGLDFNQFNAGKDVHFTLGNPICATVVATSYMAVKVSMAAMNKICKSGSGVPRIWPSPIKDFKDLAKAAKKIGAPACAVSFATATSSFLSAMQQMNIIYLIADSAFKKVRICGNDWMGPNTVKHNISNPRYKKSVMDKVEEYYQSDDEEILAKLNINSGDKYYREWYYGGKEFIDNPDEGKACRDPTQPKVNGHYPVQKYYLKGLPMGNYNCDKYLVKTGDDDPLSQNSNFSIGEAAPSGGLEATVISSSAIRGNPYTKERRLEMQKAYECCIQRSSQYVCIEHYEDENNKEHKFCKAGERCTIKAVTYEAYPMEDNRYVCAKSYSLCPFNFHVGGGAEDCEYYQDGIWDSEKGAYKYITGETLKPIDGSAPTGCNSESEIRNSDCTYNDKAGKCKNYCQHMTHCTTSADIPFIYNSVISSPYFSTACLNFVGDSLNKTAFAGGFLLGSQRHFSAPIAQCFKETMSNLFYNQAGHSKCHNSFEYPSSTGVCASGQYIKNNDGFDYKLGNPVLKNSFFEKIQDVMHDFVKITITLSVIFFGGSILTGQVKYSERKDIILYVIKIGLVLFFATGTAWQHYFFDGIYNTSTEFAKIIFKIEVSKNEEKRDGCQFGTITTPDGVTTKASQTYPEGKEYLAIWDTLDCKIMRYMGFGPEVSVANIIILIFAGFFTGTVGIYFSISVLIFAFMLIAATIKGLHIFLVSTLTIIVLIFVSPLMFLAMLFKKTNDIFKKWLTGLISAALQPVILFAYIAIFIIVLDRTLIAEATYRGTAPGKTIQCNKYCLESGGEITAFDLSQEIGCEDRGGEVINPLDTSFACLMDLDSTSGSGHIYEWPGFEIIGISIPILINLFSENPRERILTVLKAALVMYLLYKFMDEIPGIITSLIGGAQFPSANPSAMGMMRKLAGIVRGVQKRANRVLMKAASAAMSNRKGGSKKEDEDNKDVDTNSDVDAASGGDGEGSNATGSSNDGAEGSSGSGSSNDGAEGSSGSGSSNDGAEGSSGSGSSNDGAEGSSGSGSSNDGAEGSSGSGSSNDGAEGSSGSGNSDDGAEGSSGSGNSNDDEGSNSTR